LNSQYKKKRKKIKKRRKKKKKKKRHYDSDDEPTFLGWKIKQNETNIHIGLHDIDRHLTSLFSSNLFNWFKLREKS